MKDYNVKMVLMHKGLGKALLKGGINYLGSLGSGKALEKMGVHAGEGDKTALAVSMAFLLAGSIMTGVGDYILKQAWPNEKGDENGK